MPPGPRRRSTLPRCSRPTRLTRCCATPPRNAWWLGEPVTRRWDAGSMRSAWIACRWRMGGRAAWVLQTGTPFQDGHVDADPIELPGIKEELGVRSSLLVPLNIGGEQRGVLLVSSAQPEYFT